jgi:hypothetical protein
VLLLLLLPAADSAQTSAAACSTWAQAPGHKQQSGSSKKEIEHTTWHLRQSSGSKV